MEQQAKSKDERNVEFIYNPWKMKDVRRLYISLMDGAKVGYLDLATLDVVPESEGTEDLLRLALSGLAPDASMQRLNHTDPSILSPGPVEETGLPWVDIATHRPGQLIESKSGTSYRLGVAGEQRTAGVLAGLERMGYRVLHSVPLSPRKDIDHLVIGPTGLWAVNTKATSYEVTANPDGAVFSDGYRQKWNESILRDAAVAGQYLSLAARMELQCRPLVAVWSTMNVFSKLPSLVPGENLPDAILEPANFFPDSWVDVVYNAARRSDTWTAHH